MDALKPYLMAILPTIGLFTLFYFVMKNVLEADRRERIAQREWEIQHAGGERIAPARIPSVPVVDVEPRESEGLGVLEEPRAPKGGVSANANDSTSNNSGA